MTLLDHVFEIDYLVENDNGDKDVHTDTVTAISENRAMQKIEALANKKGGYVTEYNLRHLGEKA